MAFAVMSIISARDSLQLPGVRLPVTVVGIRYLIIGVCLRGIFSGLAVPLGRCGRGGVDRTESTHVSRIAYGIRSLRFRLVDYRRRRQLFRGLRPEGG